MEKFKLLKIRLESLLDLYNLESHHRNELNEIIDLLGEYISLIESGYMKKDSKDLNSIYGKLDILSMNIILQIGAHYG